MSWLKKVPVVTTLQERETENFTRLRILSECPAVKGWIKENSSWISKRENSLCSNRLNQFLHCSSPHSWTWRVLCHSIRDMDDTQIVKVQVVYTHDTVKWSWGLLCAPVLVQKWYQTLLLFQELLTSIFESHRSKLSCAGGVAWYQRSLSVGIRIFASRRQASGFPSRDIWIFYCRNGLRQNL